MDSKRLAMMIAHAAEEKKARDIVVLDLRKLTTFTDFFVICSGSSDRQVQAIARALTDEIKAHKRKPIGVEGERGGRWILIDFGDVVAHVFYHEERDYYQIEKLWSDAPRVALTGSSRAAHS